LARSHSQVLIQKLDLTAADIRCERLYNHSAGESPMPVSIKRVYDPPARQDGFRVLVDRLWPRGLSKASAAIDEWLRDVAPSNELRRWYHARLERWQAFREKYLAELEHPPAHEALARLTQLSQQHARLTLLYGSKNMERNNAVVLQELLSGGSKPAAAPSAASRPGKRAEKRPARRG
jgi:uncharacterized protein YeaO (DUF488 family)